MGLGGPVFKQDIRGQRDTTRLPNGTLQGIFVKESLCFQFKREDKTRFTSKSNIFGVHEYSLASI